MAVTWDILVASVISRTDKLAALLTFLAPQITDGVRVLVARDNLDLSIGDKRQRLLDASDADYVAFVDDDDEVSDKYVELVTAALSHNPDVVGFRLLRDDDGIPRPPLIHTIHYGSTVTYADYPDIHSADYQYHLITHLNPIRRSIAVTGRFEGNENEDGRWGAQVRDGGLIRDECYIDEILYYYHRSDEDCFRTHAPLIGDEPEVPQFPFVRYV